ncbi:ABC transporter substrate-binding protein [Aquamicrobium sp. LC103]|uniref:ABC transporter substrate-binding protein n=1 Tax=Aquamicrobium sp. LC103 TaxID=1120658 RepID=UPI00063EAFA0|nr:ABC transporter substrate-binding protein [Aquamicrobium sp. LC103]TKT78353.1 ABC transporter substrate-binding protein [Aquamicrobium sp. LC103]
MFTRRDIGKLVIGAGAVSLATPFKLASAQDRPTLTIAVDNLWQNMATINGISTTSRRIFPNFYDGLVDRDYINDENGLILAPKLATSWEQNGNVWSFELRQGVLFHDGTEMTAEDAAFTLSADRLWGPKPFEPRGKTFTDGFKRVEATGKYTFEIETERPDPYIPGKLTGYMGLVVPKKYYLEKGVDGFGQAPVGTGPYKVTTFRSGEVMVLDAFDDYWDGAPPAKQVIWKIVPEFSGRMAGLVSGEFDFIVNIPTDQEATLEGYDKVKLIRATASNYPAFAFNTRPDPEDNPLVDANLRYAMVQAIDMDTIVQALFGEATFHPAVPFNFPEYGRFYDPALKPLLPYDPVKAKELVQKSGYDGRPLRWHITRQFYPNYEAAAEIMIEQWREVGINVQAIVLDNFELVYRRPFHLMNMSMSTDFIPGDPYQPLWLDWGPTASRSTASWKTWDPTEKFIELGNIFERQTEFEARKKAYQDLSAEWQRVTPGYYMWKSVYNWAHRDDIEWKPRADGEMRMFGDYLKLS